MVFSMAWWWELMWGFLAKSEMKRWTKSENESQKRKLRPMFERIGNQLFFWRIVFNKFSILYDYYKLNIFYIFCNPVAFFEETFINHT